MNMKIGSSHGSDNRNVQPGSAATATPSDAGELAGGARFRPETDSGKTKAQDRHRLGGGALHSFVSRIAKGVKALPVVRILKGGAARTHPANPADELNKLRQATLASHGPMRPTTTNPSLAEASLAPASQSMQPSPADVPPAPPPQALKPARPAPPPPPPAHLKPRLADAAPPVDTSAATAPDPEVLALRKQIDDLQAELARMKQLMAQSSAMPSAAAPSAPPPPPADLMTRPIKPAQGSQSSLASLNDDGNASQGDGEGTQPAKLKPVLSDAQIAFNAELSERLAARRRKQESAEAVSSETSAGNTGSVSGSSRSRSDDE
ncbi:hypothetical protein CEY04_01380 [Achromobacter sp. HZ28]|nr:hypothetical protein CEY05_01380 [Achromobacter sp. HZ34]OWT81991.1 hypothetical protein CEY04_01380 [Achromobacter sp. HZ28]